MTDLIERVDIEAAPEAPAAAPPDTSGHPQPHHDGRLHTWTVSPGSAVLAVVLGCSALLLFVSAAPRFTSWRTGAVAFVIVGWVQIMLGLAVLFRPRRTLFLSIAAVNVGVVGLWAAALVGRHVNTDFEAGVGIALSAVAVVAGLALAHRPLIGRHWQSSTIALASIVPVAIVVITTTALALPPTAEASAPAPASPAHPASTSPNPFFNSVKVPGQNSSRFLQIASGNDTEKSELQPWVPLSPSDQAVLEKQLFLAEEAAFRYPTVADAKKAGLILAGGMAPGVGAHYQSLNPSAINGVNADGTINPADPGSWIYASTADDAPVVGVMYEAFTPNAPVGFAGPNDHWHQHSNLCVTYADGKIGVPFAPDTSVTQQQCATAHGVFMKKTLWMVHAWVVPGWESPLGPFSHSNPHLYCPGNTDLTDAIGFCLRQQ
jgi:hypothetical protein